MSYLLEFTIQGLPKMSNQLLRGNWRVNHGHAKRWKRLVWRQCWHLRPDEPLSKARLTLTRCSTREPDLDGLVSGFKHIIDGLVEARVLEGDKPSNIGSPEYVWKKAKPRQGLVRVKVEAA